MTSCLSDLQYSVLEIKTKIVRSYTADSKPVKQEVNSTVIHPPLVFPDNSDTKWLALLLSSLIFAVKGENLPQCLEGSPLGSTSALPANIRLGYNRLPVTH